MSPSAAMSCAPRDASSSPLIAVTACGTSCRASSRRWTVTSTESSCSAPACRHGVSCRRRLATQVPRPVDTGKRAIPGNSRPACPGGSSMPWRRCWVSAAGSTPIRSGDGPWEGRGIGVGLARAPAQVGHQAGARDSRGRDATFGFDNLERARDDVTDGPNLARNNDLEGLRGRSEGGQAEAGDQHGAKEKKRHHVTPLQRDMASIA